MQLYKFDITTTGTFFSPLKGDMIFGMFCAIAADYVGSDKLKSWLQGYTEGKPFVVFSDVFPVGFLPKPCLPSPYWGKFDDSDQAVQNRKKLKKQTVLSLDKFNLPSSRMLPTADEMQKNENKTAILTKILNTNNRIDPLTNHASGGKYSAYTTEQFVYNADVTLYAVLDDTRILPAEVADILQKMGEIGFGKKASSGHGKFVLKHQGERVALPLVEKPNAYMTLAPSVPLADEFDNQNSFYKIFVRFGRHGGDKALASIPFKKPVITLDCGAVLTPNTPEPMSRLFVGCGLAGVSVIAPETVFQGYAPVIPLRLEKE
jgi:CRISPR-associated protein Csm4